MMARPNTCIVPDVTMTVMIENTRKLTGSPRKIPPAHRRLAFAEAGEVAEVEQQGGEIGDHQDRCICHHPDARAGAGGRFGKLEVQAGEAGFVQNPECEGEHHEVDHGAAEVDKFSYRLHAAEEDDKLEDPHEQEAEPGQRRQAHKAVVGECFGARDQGEDENLDRLRGEVGLHAIPDDANDTADHGRQVGADDAERNPGHDRIGDAVFLRRLADEIHQPVDDHDADGHRDQHLPSGQSQEEQARGEGVAADRMDVGHPHGEQAEYAPGSFRGRGRGQIVVIQFGIGACHGGV
jgi:hypothetical protein